MAAFLFCCTLLLLSLLLLLLLFHINLRQTLEKCTKIYSYVQPKYFSVCRCQSVWSWSANKPLCSPSLSTPLPKWPWTQLLHAINHWVCGREKKTRRWLWQQKREAAELKFRQVNRLTASQLESHSVSWKSCEWNREGAERGRGGVWMAP